MSSGGTSRRKLIESARLKEDELAPESERNPVKYALRGTWTHPNPSLVGQSELLFSRGRHLSHAQKLALIVVMIISGGLLLFRYFLLHVLR